MLSVESEQEEDGRWIAKIPALPGVLVYAASQAEAIAKVKDLALRATIERIQHGEQPVD